MFFHFGPQVLYGVHVWALRRGSPPIDPFLVEELNSSPGCMLGIIILHQSVSCRIDLTKEWQERVPQDSRVQLCIHDTLKNAHSSPSPEADPGPDMYLHRMFWPACEYNIIRHATSGRGIPREIPTNALLRNVTCTHLGLWLGRSPRFRQQNRRCVSSCIDVSSVHTTSAKPPSASCRYSLAKAKRFSLFG